MITPKRVRALPMVLALAVAAAGCGTQEATTEPVFALDRDVVSEIEPLSLIDPSAVIRAADLRLLLQSLLSEHVRLSTDAMRLAVDGEDLDPTLVSLTRNTDGLTAAIGLIYGEAGAFAFDQLWTNHIEFFNRYGGALRRGDSREIEAVALELGHYETDFSSYLDAATAGELDVHTVEHLLHSHVEQLLSQADAWAAGRFDEAYRIQIEAHRHSDVIAEALATGFAAQNPALFTGEVAAPEATRCATARLAASEALTVYAESALVRADERSDRRSAVEAASAEAVRNAGDVIATPGALEDAIAAFDAEVSSLPPGAGGILAARDAGLILLGESLSDDCPA